MRSPALLAALLLLLGTYPPLATSAEETILVGSTQIRIPAPPNFVGRERFGPDVARSFQFGLPSGRTFLAAFLTEADLHRLPQRPRRYIVVSTIPEASERRLSTVEFASTRDYLRNTYRQRIERSGSTIQSQADSLHGKRLLDGTTVPAIQADQLRPIGNILETDSSFMSSEIHSYRLHEAPTGQLAIASTSTTLLVRGRVILLSVFSDYEQPTDSDWTESTSKAWLSSILRVNQDP